jgi:hypothetical protein
MSLQLLKTQFQHNPIIWLFLQAIHRIHLSIELYFKKTRHRLQMLQLQPFNKIKMKHKMIINKNKKMMYKHKTNKCIARVNQQITNIHLTSKAMDMLPRCIPTNTSTHLPNIFKIHNNITCLLLWLIILPFKSKINLLVKSYKRNSRMMTNLIKCSHFKQWRFPKSSRSLQMYHSLAMTLTKNGKILGNLVF